MKRCIVCGNVGDDSSTKCEVCGNPFIDTSGQESVQAASDTDRKEENRPEKTQQPAQERAVSQSAGATRPQRRMRSGPQIYGQQEPARGPQEAGSQGRPRQSAQRRPNEARTGQGAYQPGMQAAQPNRTVRTEHSGQPSNGRSGQMDRAPQPNRPQRPANGYSGQPGRPAFQGQPPYQAPMRQGTPAPGMGAGAAAAGSYKARQIREASRRMLQSPIFLAIAILNTLYFAGTIAAVFLREMNYSQVIRLIEGFELPAQISGYVGSVTSLLSMLDSGALFANLAMHIPDLLFLIGLWMIFVTAKKNGEEMSGIGFGFVKATVLINMVVACAVTAVLLVITVAVVISSWVSGTLPVIIGAGAAMILMIAVAMMVIMYYFCHLATIKTCRLNSSEGESYGKVSVYVAAIHILLALVSIVDLLSGIVNSEISNIVGSIGKIGWLLLLAVWFFMYREKLEEVEE